MTEHYWDLTLISKDWFYLRKQLQKHAHYASLGQPEVIKLGLLQCWAWASEPCQIPSGRIQEQIEGNDCWICIFKVAQVKVIWRETISARSCPWDGAALALCTGQGNVRLESSAAESDEGVLVGSTLNLSQKCALADREDNSALRCIRPSTAGRWLIVLLCFALEPPHLQHWVQFCMLQHKKVKKLLENIQRRATEIVKNLEGKMHEE